VEDGVDLGDAGQVGFDQVNTGEEAFVEALLQVLDRDIDQARELLALDCAPCKSNVW
jgi:polysaccharide pyruvyl transferase WcaK-like protein